VPCDKKNNFTSFAPAPRRRAAGINARGQTTARRANVAQLPSFNVGSLTAKPAPVKRRYRARRGKVVVNFNMPCADQFTLLDLPVARLAFKLQRRLLLVHAADAMLNRNLCSLNAAAIMLGCSASWLCGLLQKYRAGGDAALAPNVQSGNAGTGCRVSFYFRTA
jgi:hypothetical protein